MELTEAILSIVIGVCTAIPLIVKLVTTVKTATKEKNWNKLIEMTLAYMQTAEKKFEDGATRKEWVMSMVTTSATNVNFDIDEETLKKLSDLIDGICDASHIINDAAEK